MEYRQLGTAGITVSRLCIGTYDFYQDEGEAGAIQSVHEALDAGVTFFDTADQYGSGLSEQYLAKALGSRRDEVVISTKLWAPMHPTDRNARGCGRAYMMKAVEASLKRLNTSYIDIYLLHHPDVNAPAEETLSTMDQLVKQGKVRYTGACNHYAWQLAHMQGVAARHNWEPLSVVQVNHNLFHRPADVELAHFCRRFNMGVMTYGVFAATLLSGAIRRGKPYTPIVERHGGPGQVIPLVPGHSADNHEDKLFDLIETFQAIADKYQIGLNQLALRWNLSRDWITSVLIGGSRPAYFRQLYTGLDVAIDPADFDRMDQLTLPFRYRPYDNQGQVAGAAQQRNWW